MDWIAESAQAWKREYPALDSSCLPPLVRAARLGVLIESFQQAVLEPFELSASDYGVLAALRRSGTPYRLSPSLLYSRLQRSSGGMTKMLKRLEERGLVARVPDPEDGRGLLVELTKSGSKLQEEIFNAFLAASQDLFVGFRPSETRQMDAALEVLTDSLEEFLGLGGLA
jgi:DNA-binding MarR family transcriptional regulator